MLISNMSNLAKNNRQSKKIQPKLQEQLPQSFAQAAKRVEQFALVEMQKLAEQKQLYYHNCVHVNEVKQRADKIFKAIVPFLSKNCDSEAEQADWIRMKQLLELSAIVHDMVQEFIPQTELYTPRRREPGVNEAATIVKLITYIENLNQQILHQNPQSSAIFTQSDIHILKEAIESTVCLYDPKNGDLYQALLYNSEQKISLPALILALADVGTLGMEGIEAYNQEGSLIFLEENPDVIPILWDETTQRIKLDNDIQDQEKQELYENIRQRLLRRARFQVNFAKGRYSKFDCEVAQLPIEAIQVFKTDVFKYLTESTIQEIDRLTPTKEQTTLQELIGFFQLEKHIRVNSKLN